MPFTLKYNPESKKRTLVEFSNGTPVNGSKLRCTVYQDKRQNNPDFQDKKILVVDGTYVQYIGNNFAHKEKYPKAQRYVVAELNKHTGEAQVFETDYYKLQPAVGISEDGEDTVTKEIEKSRLERNDDLTKAFGSIRKKRAMEARHRNQVVNTASAVMESVETYLDDPDLLTEEPTSDSLVPCNLSATSVEDVYPIQQVIPIEIIDSVAAEATKFMSLTDETIMELQQEKPTISYDYIIKHARKPNLVERDDRDAHMDHACYLQILIHLVFAYKQRKDVFTSGHLKKTNDTFKHWLASEFFVGDITRPQKLKMPSRLKSKAIAYALVIAWHLDSFACDGDRLLELFGFSKTTFSLHVRGLGGKTRMTSNGQNRVYRATLSLPLVFPTRNRRKRIQ